MSSRLLILLVAAAMLLQTGVGYADAIDGEWCSTDGMRMSIRGEKITIPSGKQIEGNYTRHAFDYVVPAGENGSGDVVSIILRSEYLALSRQGAGRGTFEGMASLQGKHQLNAAMPWSMIRKSGNRFSEKIMLKQRDEIMIRFNLIGS
jgi:hypothetical protein